MQNRETFLDRLPKEIKDELLRLRNQQGRTVLECAVWLTGKIDIAVPRTTLSDWFLRQRRQEITAPQRQVPSESQQQQEEENLQEKVSTDKIIESHKARAAYFERAYKESIKNSSGLDDLVRVAKEVTNAISVVQIKIPHYGHIQTSSVQSVIAPLCDAHIGEVVDPKQMGGLNAYNMEIFNERLYFWAQKVIELTNLRRSYTKIDDLHVPLLGDLVSGEIHLELMKTNEDNIMGQMIRGANLIAQALVKLSSQFENVYVPCVVGNHGRMEQKPPAKNMYVSWDYLLAQWAASFCRDQKNIHFTIPKSFFHVFTVANRKILMMHGDSIKGGFAGLPYYGFNRAAAYLRQTLQLNKNSIDEEVFSYFDAIIIGHFHKHEEIDLGTGPMIVCGCIKGTDEYAFAKLHVASRPSQPVTFWHPKHGYISKDIVYLDRFNFSNEKFEDKLSDVWVES